MLYEYLLENYKTNEPIFTSDIELGLSGNTLRPLLKQLCNQGLLNRFDRGVFYIQSQSRLKGRVPISSETVAKYRYIIRRGKVEGYYSGYTLANRVGMTTQVPVTVEIVSNEASAEVRDIKIKDQTIRLRKPKTTVTKDNVKVLQFLDLVCEVDRLSDESKDVISNRLRDIIKKQNIQKQDIDAYISLYPIKVYKNFYEYGLCVVFA